MYNSEEICKIRSATSIESALLELISISKIPIIEEFDGIDMLSQHLSEEICRKTIKILNEILERNERQKIIRWAGKN